MIRRFPVLRALKVAAALLVLPGAAAGQYPRNVLIVRGEAPDLPGGTVIVEKIVATVRTGFGGQVEFFVETIDTGRFPSVLYDQRLADLYAAKYTRLNLDLVIAFTEPAVAFVARERPRLFPRTPLLFGMIEERFLQNLKVPEDAVTVAVQVDAAATLRLALTTYPMARRVVVVGGTSRFDRGWLQIVREDLRDFDPRVSISYDTDSSHQDVLRKVAALPADTIVLFVSMTRDGINSPKRPADVLQSLREVSKVPIYGLSTTYLGRGMVGGVVLDHDRHGVDLGKSAIRMLRGEHPGLTTTPAASVVDWREIKRFGMSTLNLSPETRIAFRERGLWELQKGLILTVAFVIAAESGLILTLVWLVRRRREAQRQLEQRLRFERMLSNMAFSLTSATPAEIDDAITAAITRIASALGIDHVWRWEFGREADSGWDSPQIRAGQPALFGDASRLPPTIAAELRAEGSSAQSSVAVPLAPGGTPAGALFWVSRTDPGSWRVRPSDLLMVASVVSNVLERRRAEHAFKESDRLRGAILDSLPAQVAVLDRNGMIIAVNHSWLEFARENGAESAARIGVGSSYTDACADGVRAGEPGAAESLALIEAACRGVAEGKTVEYRCDSPGVQRWFLMSVQPLRREDGGAVVAHSDITMRKTNEIAVRESEDRFRRLADALPVAIWMSEADSMCSYFNAQWLQMTGRSLEQELGIGWLDGVHPDDRAGCMEAYQKAFHARELLRIEWRIKRHDGTYRWLLDTGMPRYGTDGAFHGYVGGCIDITERMEAELMLRVLNRQLILAQEDERRRIARELHDHLSQQLALLAIHLQQLSIAPPNSIAALSAALDDEWRRTAEIASDVHAISHRLHPSKLEALGLVATIRSHCRDLSLRETLAVHFSEKDVPPDISADVALCLYRVLEEALNNVTRHSGVTEAHVALIGEERDLVLRVSDSGCGFPPERTQKQGLGVVSMRERLQALGGTLSITSAAGKGTVVEARVLRTPAPAAVHVRRVDAAGVAHLPAHAVVTADSALLRPVPSSNDDGGAGRPEVAHDVRDLAARGLEVAQSGGVLSAEQLEADAVAGVKGPPGPDHH